MMNLDKYLLSKNTWRVAFPLESYKKYFLRSIFFFVRIFFEKKKGVARKFAKKFWPFTLKQKRKMFNLQKIRLIAVLKPNGYISRLRAPNFLIPPRIMKFISQLQILSKLPPIADALAYFIIKNHLKFIQFFNNFFQTMGEFYGVFYEFNNSKYIQVSEAFSKIKLHIYDCKGNLLFTKTPGQFGFKHLNKRKTSVLNFVLEQFLVMYFKNVSNFLSDYIVIFKNLTNISLIYRIRNILRLLKRIYKQSVNLIYFYLKSNMYSDTYKRRKKPRI
jgi:hypothetical protein